MDEIDLDNIEGATYLDLASRVEAACATTTAAQVSTLGDRAPECLDRLGRSLNTLSGAAGCRWGCSNSDHLPEALLGRAACSGHAAYRLLMSGFYDESLCLIRSISELSNLFALFVRDASALTQWKAAPRRERLSAFSPVKIRLRLEALQAPIPIDKMRYAALCEAAVHVTPETRPNAHNPDRVPRLGGEFQPRGFLVTLNELAWVLCSAMVTGANLISTEGVAERLSISALALNDCIGGVTLCRQPEVFDTMSSKPQTNTH